MDIRKGNMPPGIFPRTLFTVLGIVAIVLLAVVIDAAQAQSFSVLYTFKGKPDASAPVSPLMQDASGNLYGTSVNGGSADLGTIFKVDPNGNETVLYSFKGAPDGSGPHAGVSLDSAGNLYGTTVYGGITGERCGTLGCGVVFKLDINGNETVLYRFTGGTDGAFPSSSNGVVFPPTPNCCDDSGSMYGTTAKGGDLSCPNASPAGTGCGVLFKLDPDGNETVLGAFHGDSGGFFPGGVLIVDNELQIWGTTTGGGGQGCYDPSRGITVGCGLAYVRVPSGGAHALYRFNGIDGHGPNSMLFANVYDIYGSTATGGTGTCGGTGCGTVFKLHLNGNTLTSLHSFNFTDGALPRGNVALDAAGSLYGTTSWGGNSNGDGVIFKVDASGNETVLHTFTRATDGGSIYSGLVPDGLGNFYGAAAGGGQFDAGTIFKFTPSADFFLSATALAPDKVTAGQSSNSSLDVASIGGFSGSVSLACAVQPSPSRAPKCSISPGSITPGTAATLTVTTTATTRAFHSSTGLGLLYAMWLPLIGCAVVGVCGPKRRRRAASLALGCVLIAGLTLQMACGGGNPIPDGSSPGTPAGTYTLTITGTDTSASLQHSTTTTLTVQ
jgi:uncharacterized repeat protein (TIGR03803 family)